MKCPQCGETQRVTRVEAIVNSQTFQQNGSFSSGTVGVGMGMNGGVGIGGAATSGVTQGTSRSNLAIQLAPPIMEKTVGIYIIYLGIGALPGLFVAQMVGMIVHAIFHGGAGIVGLLAFIAVEIPMFKIANKKAKKKQLEYREQYSAWQRTWYCEKCGGVYEM